jgi:hypothetical protein
VWDAEVVCSFGKDKNTLSLPEFAPRAVQVSAQSLYRLAGVYLKIQNSNIRVDLTETGGRTWTGNTWFTIRTTEGTLNTVLKVYVA